MIRTFARITAILLLAYALVGFAILGWGLAAIFYHAGVGLLFALIGFWPSVSGETSRQMVGGLGALLVVGKVAMILTLWMLPMRSMHGPIEITCLVVGIASILAARYLPEKDKSMP